MAQWGEIKQNFIDWLKTQDVDYKDSERGIAHIKYKDQFKLFIEKHDGDDNLNMDSFTKTKDGDNTLAEDMVKDYVANLDKDDKAFAALDTDGDGVISNNETNAFINRSIEAGFDDNADDFSFDDFVTAVNKINTDDTGFLTGNNNGNNAAGAAGNGANANGANGNNGANANGANGNNGANVNGANGNNGNDGKGAGDGAETALTAPQQVSELSSIAKDYTGKRVQPTGLKINEPADVTTHIPSSGITTDNVGDIKTNITAAMEQVTADFASYKDAYTASASTCATAENYIATNESQYNEIIGKIAESNENVRVANEQIVSLESSVVAISAALETQFELKDGLTQESSAIGSRISSLQAALGSAEDEDRAAIQSEIAALQSAQQQIEAQLRELAQQILENQELLNQTNENLQQAYSNLEVALSDVDLTQFEGHEMLGTIIENKKVLSQAKCDMTSAQAGMVAMDAYMASLEAELAELEEFEKELESAEGDPESGEPTEAEGSQDKTNGLEYPEGVIGLTPAQNNAGEPIEGYPKLVDGNQVYKYENGLEIITTQDGEVISAQYVYTDQYGNTMTVSTTAEEAEMVQDSGDGSVAIITQKDDYIETEVTKDGEEVWRARSGKGADGNWRVDYDKVDPETKEKTTTSVSEQSKDGKESIEVRNIKKDPEGNIVSDTTTTTTTHATGGSQGGAMHTVTVIKDNLTNETKTIEKTVSSNGNGNTETTVIKTNDGNAEVTTTREVKTDKEGNVVLDETVTTEKSTVGSSSGGKTTITTTTTNNITGEVTVEEKVIAGTLTSQTETTTTTKTSPDNTTTTTKEVIVTDYANKTKTTTTTETYGEEEDIYGEPKVTEENGATTTEWYDAYGNLIKRETKKEEKIA